MKKYSLLIALSLLIVSCAKDTKEIKVDTTPAVAVEVSSSNLQNSNPFFTASGKIKAINYSTLSTRTSGFVEKIHVTVGDKVTKGKLLLSISNIDLQAKLAQVNASITEATAAFNNAEKDYNRFKNLFAENSASQKEMDDMTANFEMAKARLESVTQMRNEINAQFKYVNIKAPFSGVVTNKYIETGDLANPGMPLISIESPGNFEVKLSVPESEISQIKKGSSVSVLVKSISEIVNGTVSEVSTSATNTGGQYLVKITLDKTKLPILSGMYTNVKFPSNRKSASNNILIPVDALVTRGQLSGVYTVSQSQTALLRWLRLGKTFGDQIEVLSGLKANEKYIVSAESKLYNGAKISIK